MNINPINSGISFRARLSDSVKSSLTNKDFQRQLEERISASETLRKFDAPDNEIVLQAREEYGRFGLQAVWPRTILKGSINGVPVEAELNYSSRWSVPNNDTYLKDLNWRKEHHQTALKDIEGAEGKEWEIRSQMVRNYVEQMEKLQKKLQESK